MAAVDIGANNLAAVTTSQGDHRLYHGRPAFHTFHTHTKQIAELQSLLGDGDWSSKQIRRVYHKRGEQRNHAMDALIRDLGEWLAELVLQNSSSAR
ncbi:transposase [Natronoarchaeum sp. GCM10025703]|uniref:transposase n=1 Tax=Natronoarchaeum sp. GCM10025703 TaxID=3252685 RepID=UPI0036065917